MEACLWQPGSIAFDKEGALYIVEDDNRKNGHDRDIRIAPMMPTVRAMHIL